MTLAIYVVAGVAIAAVLLGWLGGRMIERLRDPLAVGGNLAMRFCFGVVFSLLAANAAHRGHYAWIEFGVLVAAAGFMFTIAGGMLWVWASRRLNDSELGGDN